MWSYRVRLRPAGAPSDVTAAVTINQWLSMTPSSVAMSSSRLSRTMASSAASSGYCSGARPGWWRQLAQENNSMITITQEDVCAERGGHKDVTSASPHLTSPLAKPGCLAQESVVRTQWQIDAMIAAAQLIHITQ